jgi:hypothetical protein
MQAQVFNYVQTSQALINRDGRKGLAKYPGPNPAIPHPRQIGMRALLGANAHTVAVQALYTSRRVHRSPLHPLVGLFASLGSPVLVPVQLSSSAALYIHASPFLTYRSVAGLCSVQLGHGFIAVRLRLASSDHTALSTMLTSMCSALIDQAASPDASNGDTSLVLKSPVELPVADADASVDVSSVITQYMGPQQQGPAKWQQASLLSPGLHPSRRAEPSQACATWQYATVLLRSISLIPSCLVWSDRPMRLLSWLISCLAAVGAFCCTCRYSSPGLISNRNSRTSSNSNSNSSSPRTAAAGATACGTCCAVLHPLPRALLAAQLQTCSWSTHCTSCHHSHPACTGRQ